MKTVPGARILAASSFATAVMSILALCSSGCRSAGPVATAPPTKTQIVFNSASTPGQPQTKPQALAPAAVQAPAPGSPAPAKPVVATPARPPETLAELNALLEKKPELSKNPEFVKRYTQAQAREYYFDGRKFIDQSDWPQAIAALEKSVEVDPQRPEVKELLATTRTRAAQRCHVQAVKAATGGDLIRALQWMDTALSYDPGNLEMQKARKTLAAGNGTGPADRSWRESADLEKNGQLCGALKKGEETLAFDPKHLAALAARVRLPPLITQARKKLAPVGPMIANGDLEEAEASLATIETTCRDLPELAVVRANLAKAKAGRQQTLRDIDTLAAAGDWNGALAKIKEAKALVPDTTQLNKKALEIRKTAANSCKDAAIKLLKEQRYAEAKKQLRQGVAFVSDNEGRDLWQQFWLEGGGILDRRGHAGAAYLWYMQGISLKPDADAQRQVNDLTAIIMHQFSYRLDASLVATDPRLQIESDLLKKALAAELQKLPETWGIVAADPATAALRASLVITVSDIRMNAEPLLVRKASQVRNYTKPDGERGRWEYTVEEYRKSGEVRHSIKLSNGNRDIIQPVAATWNWYVADQIIDRPNPALGLRDAVLNLPANDEFRSLLLERFVATQINNSMSAIFENLISTLELEAGKKEDLESYLDLRGAAYFLLLQSDPKRAASLLQDALKF